MVLVCLGFHPARRSTTGDHLQGCRGASVTSLSNRLRTLAGVPSALSLIVIVSALLGSIGPASTDRIVVAATINVVFVVGLYIFSGNSGIMSFGHLSFATVGGYTAGLLVMPTALKEQLTLIVHENW